MKKILYRITPLIIIFVLFIALSQQVFSQEATPTPTPTPDNTQERLERQKALSEEISKLEGQLSNTQMQAKTLSNEVAQMNSQIQLTFLQIEETKNKLETLASDINNLIRKINRLENSLDEIAGILLNRVRETYIKGKINSLDLVFSSTGFADLLNKWKYLKVAQAHDKKLMYQIQTTKVNYEDQKKLLEEKKKEQERLKVQMENYQITLNNQKKDKEQLLTATRNDEKKFQELLVKARNELSGYAAFTQSAGGGITSFGGGSNGWYFTQRDPAWGNMLMPGSSSTMLEAGCAVTSVAMVCKSYGENITPGSIASNSSNFFYGDLWNWAFACSGKNTNWLGSSQGEVQSYVKNNTPVILRLVAPSVSGLHFVVAFSWDDGKSDFKIHDPYFGPDKYFSERYSWSQVTNAIAIN